MRNKRPKALNVWRSYSDMMAGLLMLFVLIMCVSMFAAQKSYVETLEEQEQKAVIQNEYTQALIDRQNEIIDQATTIRSQDDMLSDLQTKLDEKDMSIEELKNTLNEQALLLDQKTIALANLEKELDAKSIELNSRSTELDDSRTKIASIVGIRTEVIKAIREAFKKTGKEVSIDKDSGALVLDSNVLFGYNDSVLTDDGKAILKEVLPIYYGVLLDEKYIDYIAEITFDGYTDTDGTFEYNLKLSQDRAYAVADFVLNTMSEDMNEATLEDLKGKLVVNGHSWNNPVLTKKGKVNKEKSRRVEIRFRLKDEDMVNELSKLMVE